MKKILAFIFNDNKEILMLRNNPADPKHGGDFWYTVTGNYESYETDGRDVTIREVREETNLIVKDIINLNWTLIYNYNNKAITEYAYAVFVDNAPITLNEEHIDYKWVTLDDFLSTTKWYGNKDNLSKVLTKAINKEQYFNNEIIEKAI